MGPFPTSRLLLAGALAALSCAVGCAEDEAEHTYSAGIEPTGGGEASDDGPGIDEGEAVNIALAMAEAEGHDIHAYSDIVVHTNGEGNWVVQLRRPRMIRFIEVVVDKASGDGNLMVKSAGADG